MNRNIILTAISFLIALTVNAQNDTMYFMKNGAIVNMQSIKTTDVDSVIFYKPLNQPSNTFIDERDSNIYKIVSIGNQVWMAENLKYLPSVADSTSNSYTMPFYYVYGYYGTNVADAKATSNYATYGVLYNWPAAMNGDSSNLSNPSEVQGVCPLGWHLPSDAEWLELANYLGGPNVAGGKLKEIGNTHWINPNTGAANEYDFTALPGGSTYLGIFDKIGYYGWWWSSSNYSDTDSYGRLLGYYFESFDKLHYSKDLGFSVRCIKN